MKKTVAVLFGGASSEHEVSRMSVISVLREIDREKYEPIAVGITRSGRWFKYDGDVALIEDGSWEQQTGTLCSCVLSPSRDHHGLLVEGSDGRWSVLHIDVVFPVLHGRNGEDGSMQGLIEIAGIPYVGCGVMASANCMDKDVAKKLLTAAGIPTAHWITVKSDYQTKELHLRIIKELGYPVFVKPANAGSSVGVSRAGGLEELITALDLAFKHDSKVIVEEALHGAEVECAVMGNSYPKAAEKVGQIVPLRGIYDYEGKYLDGSTKLNIPAEISEEQAEQVRSLAIRAYRALECMGLARVDFFALADGKQVILNEINTIPGFTSISMYPKLFVASGMSYSEVLTNLLELAEERENG